MTKNSDFYEYVRDDLFDHIDSITSRQMFGGYGFYKDGVFFAIIAYGKLYFKVGPSNKKEYEKHGSKPFIYTGHKSKKSTSMSYWEVPPDVLEDKDELGKWIDKAVDAQIQSKKK